MNLANRTDTVVAIIGSGIIGRIASRKFSELEIPNILISPASELRYRVEYLEKDFSPKSIYLAAGGHSSIWGNQHDIDFADFWQPPSFSDLPGFPFESSEIFDELEDLRRYLGISTRTKSLKMSSFEGSIGNRRLHLKGRSNILERRFSLENSNYVEFQVDSLHMSLSSEADAEISYRNLAGDEKTIRSRYMVFAAGGLGNLEVFDRMCRDNRIEIPKALGSGYVNHPKAITHFLKLRKYSRIRIQHTSRFTSWNLFNVFDLQTEIDNIRQPRISIRFWEMRLKEFSQNNGSSANMFQNILDLMLRKMGWHRYLKVMVYFESPQMTSACLNVQSRGQEVRISHKLGDVEGLTSFYSEAISALTKKFEENTLIDKTCQTDLDFSELPYQDSHHYMSTTRMSTDLDTGIVDKWGQVHGIPKVFCIGTSVLPVSAMNHPTYIAAALGIRTIKRLAQYISESKG